MSTKADTKVAHSLDNSKKDELSLQKPSVQSAKGSVKKSEPISSKSVAKVLEKKTEKESERTVAPKKEAKKPEPETPKVRASLELEKQWLKDNEKIHKIE